MFTEASDLQPDCRALTVDEIDAVSGASWLGAGKLLGHAIRLGAVGGAVGVAAAAGTVAVALTIDYAMDGDFDLI